MDSLDVVLLERVGPGASSLADACARLACVRGAGWNAQTMMLDGRGATEAATRGLRAFGDEDSLRRALADTARSRAPRAVVIADTDPADLPRFVPDGLAIAHWPLSIGGSRAPLAALARRVPPRWAPLDALLANAPRGAEALDLAPLTPLPNGRGRLPLWDGDYVLAPAPLDAASRARLIESFARIVADESSLDLVMLDDPDPDGEALARRLGIGIRVHFAGEAPHEAEAAWLGSASAVVFGESEGVRAGLVLRALACGAPIVRAGTDTASRALGDWLEARGCAWTKRGASLDAALESALERGADVERALEAGRGVSARHTPEALAARLSAGEARSLRAA